MGVRDVHKEFEQMRTRWKACRDTSEGEHAVHAAADEYLPRLSREANDEYARRKAMTPFFNATWRTIAGLQGMMFRKPPKVELPSALADFQKDVDLGGTPLFSFTQEIVEEALTVGRVGVLVDYPQVEPGLTLADRQSRNLRAMMCTYKAESIYNWRTQRIDGQLKLTQVRLTEEEEVPDGEFDVKCEPRWRVLDLVDGKYRQRLYKKDAKGLDEQVGQDVFPQMNGAPLNFIPFVIIGVDCVGTDVDAPPLIDLVTTNLHHYRQATSYERGCFFSGLPTMFVSGVEARGPEEASNEIAIGGPVANLLPNPDSKAYYVEVVSKFEALRTNLEDKKREMAILGARMLEGGKASGGGVEAAETVARRQSGEESVLSNMAQTVSEGLERALNWVARWEGVAETCTLQLNRDFLPTPMSAQELSALVTAWQNGAISSETLFDNLKAGEIIDDDDDFEEEQAKITADGLNLAAQQAQLGAMLPPQQGTTPPEDPSAGQPT